MISFRDISLMDDSVMIPFISGSGIEPKSERFNNELILAEILNQRFLLDEKDSMVLEDDKMFERILSRKRLDSMIYNLYIGEEDMVIFDTKIGLRDKLISLGIEIKTGFPMESSSYDVQNFILTFDSNRAKTYIEKLGNICIIIGYSLIPLPGFDEHGNKIPLDNPLEMRTITVYDDEQLISYLSIRVSPSFKLSNRITYCISGYNGLPKFHLFEILRKTNVTELSYGLESKKLSKLPFLDILIHSPMIFRLNIEKEIVYTLKKEYEKLNTGIKFFVDSDSVKDIVQKNLLFPYMKRIFPENIGRLMALSWKMDDVPDEYKDKILIVKPIGIAFFSGKDIEISTNREEFKILQSNEKIRILKDKKFYNYYVSEYIDNPMLFNGKKFHLRIHILVTSWGTVEVFPSYYVVLAKKEYKKNDYHNKDIHDTHGSSIYYFPDDFKDQYNEDILKKTNENISFTLDHIEKSLSGLVRSYPESLFGAVILGLDLLIDEGDNYNAKILEINMGTGMSYVGPIINEKDKKDIIAMNELYYNGAIKKYIEMKQKSVRALNIAYSYGCLPEDERFEYLDIIKSQRKQLLGNNITNLYFLALKENKKIGKVTLSITSHFNSMVIEWEMDKGSNFYAEEVMYDACNQYWYYFPEKIYAIVRTTDYDKNKFMKSITWMKKEKNILFDGLDHYVYSASMNNM